MAIDKRQPRGKCFPTPPIPMPRGAPPHHAHAYTNCSRPSEALAAPSQMSPSFLPPSPITYHQFYPITAVMGNCCGKESSGDNFAGPGRTLGSNPAPQPAQPRAPLPSKITSTASGPGRPLGGGDGAGGGAGGSGASGGRARSAAARAAEVCDAPYPFLLCTIPRHSREFETNNLHYRRREHQRQTRRQKASWDRHSPMNGRRPCQAHSKLHRKTSGGRERYSRAPRHGIGTNTLVE